MDDSALTEKEFCAMIPKHILLVQDEMGLWERTVVFSSALACNNASFPQHDVPTLC